MLTVGTGLAAWVAVRDAPSSTGPSTFVSQALAATADAGTAQFTLTITTGGDPGKKSTVRAFGTVNFTDHTVNVLETYRLMGISNTVSGPTHSTTQTATTQQLNADGATFTRTSFANQSAESPWYVESAATAAGPFGPLRSTIATDAISPLFNQTPGITFAAGPPSPFYSPWVEYQRAPLVQTCRLMGLSGQPGYQNKTSNSLSVWLDGKGRIREIQSADSTRQRQPLTPGRFTTAATLTFTSFGKPTIITAPQQPQQPSGNGTGVLRPDLHTTCSS